MRATNKTRKKKGPVLLLLILILTLSLLIVVGTGYFTVSEIVIEGSRFTQREDILDRAGIGIGDNIFSIRIGEAIRELELHPYINRAQIKRDLPCRVLIYIEERDLLGYIPFMGSYLLIDGEGRVVSATPLLPVKDIPVFEGIEVNDFRIEETLGIENKEIFDRIRYISNSIKDNLTNYAPVYVDIRDPENITVNLNDRFMMKVGGFEDLDYKFRYGDTILEKLYIQDIGGEIDISCGGKAFFRPW